MWMVRGVGRGGWGTGPECTTILCKGNGQVRVGWVMGVRGRGVRERGVEGGGREQRRLGTEMECTTILCKGNGQVRVGGWVRKGNNNIGRNGSCLTWLATS